MLNDSAAMDLYALPPEDFTVARDAAVKRARAAGDKALVATLSALRRPTASAYAVNALVRADPAIGDQLLDLGGRIAQAQAAAGSGATLRELGDQRRRFVQAATDRAAQAVGALGAAARAEVTATLEAAVADPASGEAVRSGCLVRALSYAGFGGVDLAGAVAPAGAAPSRDAAAPPAQRQRDRRSEASAAALTAAGAADDAVRQAEQAERRRAQAERQAAQTHERVAAAEQALAEARRERDNAQVVVRHAGRDLERARAAVTAAQRTAERARAVLARLAAPS